MFSPAFIAWVHWMCILFACSCASTCLFVLIVEGLFPVETSQRVQLQVLLLNFSALNILYYYILYAEDVSPNAPEAPPKSEVAVLSPTPTFLIRDCDHRALDHEIEMLRIENEKLQAQTTEARKDVVKAQTTKELAEQEKDKVDRKLQATEQKCKTEYLSHIDRIRELNRVSTELAVAEYRIHDLRNELKAHNEGCRQTKEDMLKYSRDTETYKRKLGAQTMQLRDVEKKLVQAGRQMAAKEREFKYSREVDRRQIGPLRSKLKAMERNEARAEELGKELDLILGPVTTVDLTTTIPAEPAGPLAHSDSALPSEPCSGSVEDPITIADNPQNPQGKRTLPSELCCGPNTMTEIPPTSETEPTLPFEHSSGRVEDPTTVTGRKIAKPVSRLNKVRPRTTRDEVNLLEEYFNRATADRSKPPTKEMLWDIVSQMSKVTDAAESESLEDLEKAMAVVTSIAYDSAAGKNTIPEFLADMAVALSDELGEILQKRLLEVKPQEEEDDEDDEDDEEDEEDSDEENSDEENSDEESEEE